MLAGIALGAVFLAGAPPVLAQNSCQVVSVTVTQGGFTPTPLDVWAFATVAPLPTTTMVRQIVVCPAVVLTPSVVASPSVFFVDPPSSTNARESRASARGTPSAGVAVPGIVPPVTVRDIAQRPEQFDRQVISLVGDAAGLRPSHDPRGMPYTEIRLENGGASVVAIAWGTPALHAGERIRVTGNFYARAPFALASDFPIRSVLEAELIEALP